MGTAQAGCKSNQRELLPRDRYSTEAEERLATMFNPELRCSTDADCYGTQEVCEDGVCLCQFWSPREQHRVAVYGGYMYLLGGFASRHQDFCDGKVCGDVDAGGYRQHRPPRGPRGDEARSVRFLQSRTAGAALVLTKEPRARTRVASRPSLAGT